LLWQLVVRRYIAPVYWLAVVMVAVFGTMAADVMHIVIGIPASFEDWMGVPANLSGLNWGRGTVSVGLTLLIVGFVAYVWITRVDVAHEESSRPLRGSA
jgi:uncharacterized membrane-anchored protein